MMVEIIFKRSVGGSSEGLMHESLIQTTYSSDIYTWTNETDSTDWFKALNHSAMNRMVLTEM